MMMPTIPAPAGPTRAMAASKTMLVNDRRDAAVDLDGPEPPREHGEEQHAPRRSASMTETVDVGSPPR